LQINKQIMMRRQKTNHRHIIAFFAMAMILITNISCNKDFNNVLKGTDQNDTSVVSDGSKRVLYIILDGVKGDVLRSIAPTNITTVTQKSIYSYDAIADVQYNALTQASAWATMLTGVDNSIHQVLDESFTGFDPSATPTIFSRLKTQLSGSTRSVSLSSSTNFIDKLSQDADVKTKLSSDEEVKSAIIQELSTDNPTLVVGQFRQADDAAGADYSITNQSYVDAIQILDGYIGEIMSALNNRKTYAKENWLVVIASSKGGGNSGGIAGSNIYDDGSRNTFVSFYNTKFRPQANNKPDVDALPYVGVAPKFQSNNATINGLANQSNTSVGNFGDNGNFTMMFKIRNDGTSAQYYPMFVGKRNPANTDVGSGGWSFLMGENSFQFDWGGSPRPGISGNFRDGKWHTIGVTIFTEGSQRKLALFYDGVRNNLVNISGNHNNNFPLRLGTDSRFNTNLLIRDFVILNKALTDEEMISTMRREFGPLNPHFANAILWAPGNEESGDKMLDLSGNDNHFNFTPSIQFSTFNDISANVSPNLTDAAFSAVPNGVDIPVVIYNWLNISVPKHWNLMGKSFIPSINLPRE